jgi:hydroxymethylpyrimidine pyrophosphatase-like HAD family hydrolase
LPGDDRHPSLCPRMSPGASLRLLSTDFDGTIHDDFGDPKIPHRLQERIAAFQARGGHWVINTGRDMASLMETLGRARVSVQPDYLILVEREIYERKHDRFVPVEPWNSRCTDDHARLFRSLATELEQQIQSLSARHEATFYADPFSPLCAIARSNLQMDEIHAELDTFCERHPELVAVRNDIYVRLSHRGYSKGTALSELGRILGIGPEARVAAGDHLNDLPMLRREHAHHLISPYNALAAVQMQVKAEGGWIAGKTAGNGTLEGLIRLGL